MRKKIIIGLTGGFGTGKSTVARIFGRLGAVIIDADKIAHKAISPGGPVYKKAISLFGRKIVKGNGRIDRKRLAAIVFGDKKKLHLLNSLIHPEVIKEARRIVKRRHERKKVFLIDAPLLIEAGMHNEVDILIVVTADKDTRFKRLIKNFDLSTRDIRRRISNQMPLYAKARMADFIIDNNGPISSTGRAVKKIWEELRDGTG